jgi:hypothetical protein
MLRQEIAFDTGKWEKTGGPNKKVQKLDGSIVQYSGSTREQ